MCVCVYVRVSVCVFERVCSGEVIKREGDGEVETETERQIDRQTDRRRRRTRRDRERQGMRGILMVKDGDIIRF